MKIMNFSRIKSIEFYCGWKLYIEESVEWMSSPFCSKTMTRRLRGMHRRKQLIDLFVEEIQIIVTDLPIQRNSEVVEITKHGALDQLIG